MYGRTKNEDRNFFTQLILATYDTYVSQEDTKDHPDVTTFWTRIKGTFHMFQGYLGNPMVLEKNVDEVYERVPAKDDVIDVVINEFQNHFGLYDYFTLLIPYYIEAFFRGNWLATRGEQNFCQGLFTLIPIVPVLAAIRAVFGLIGTAFALPIVVGEYVHDKYNFARMIDKGERDNLKSNEQVKSFTAQYRELKEALGRAKREAKKQDEQGNRVKQDKPQKTSGNAEIAAQKLGAIRSFVTEINSESNKAQAFERAQTKEGMLFNTKSTKIARQMKKIAVGGKHETTITAMSRAGS